MEELVDVLKRAQSAVLHAQYDLIQLRHLQDEGKEAIKTSADYVNNDALLHQLRAQSKQEDAVQHLERGVRLMRNLLKDPIQQKPNNNAVPQEAPQQQQQTERSEQELKINAVKQAMQRYIEGQRNLKQQWEWELHAKLTAKDDCIDEVRHNAADLVRRVTERRVLARALHKWRRRTASLVAGCERNIVAQELGRMRTTLAKSFAAARAVVVLRQRCFHRWHLQMMRSLMRKEQQKHEELSMKLQHAEEELQRQHDVLIEALDAKRPDAGLKLQRQQHEEILRLRSVVDGMVREFKERTDTYIRQQEELSQYYEERQAMLMEEVVIAEVRRQQQDEVLRCRVFETSKHKQWTEALCGLVADCVKEKALALYNEALAANNDSNQYCNELEALLLQQRHEVIESLKARVQELERRCAEAGELLDGCNNELHERNIVIRSLKETFSQRLLRVTTTQRMHGYWVLWQRHAEVRRQNRRLHDERIVAQQQRLVVMEEMDRRCIIQLEDSALKLVGSWRSCSQAEVLSEETLAELSETSTLCASLQEEVGQLRSYNAELLDTQNAQVSAWFASKLECLLEAEHARRMELRYSELRTRKALDRMTADHNTAVMRQKCAAMQVQLDNSLKQLHHVGALVAEYCARSAFNCWLLSTERRRHKRVADKTRSCITIGSVRSLDESTQHTISAPSKESGSLQMQPHHSGWDNASEVLLQRGQGVDQQSNVTNMERLRYSTTSGVSSSPTETCVRVGDVEQLMGVCHPPWTPLVAVSGDPHKSPGGIQLNSVMHFILAERDTVIEYTHNVASAVWSAAADAIVAQQCAHKAIVEELQQYQSFLEKRIAVSGAADAEAPYQQQEAADRIKFLQEQWEKSESNTNNLRLQLEQLQAQQEKERATQKRIESQLASVRESRDRYEKEVEVLQRRVGEQWEHNELVKEKLLASQQDIKSLQAKIEEEKNRYKEDVGALRRRIDEYKVQDEKAHQKLLDAQKQIESLLATLEEERYHHQVEVMKLEEQVEDQKLQEEKAQRAVDIASASQSREICMLRAETARLSAQLEEAQKENELNSALRDTIRQYERTLASLEKDVVVRTGEFSASLQTLADLDGFSNTLLLRHKQDVEQLFELSKVVGGSGGGYLIESAKAASEGQQAEEVDASTAEGTVKKQEQQNSGELQQRLSESQQLVDSLLSTLEKINEQHKKEVTELQQHLKEHRRREEKMQKAAAAARANYEREMCVLRAEGKRLTAQVEELMASTSTAEQKRELVGLETQKQLEEAHNEVKGLKTELKTMAMHHAIECDRLRTTVDEQRTTIESLKKGICGSHKDGTGYGLATGDLLQLMEEMVGLACEHTNEKAQLYLTCCAGEWFRQECIEGERRYSRGASELRECMELLLTTLGRTNAQYQKEKDDNEKQMEALQQLIRQQQQQNDAEQEAGAEEGCKRPTECPLRSSAGAEGGVTSSQPWLCCRCDSPLQRERSKAEVVQSIARYSDMLQQQHDKNRSRLEQLNKLVAQVDELMEYGRSLSLPEQ
ncbi:hypothetical protein, conserved [Trypanosoma brucei brucei TREU927]|uniref:Uncharacterized protein n=1 Tax=Trypanosoma brucei brucei (strain 927/4 GUTat10.1) TaxID=185431 RepID=Q57YR5_TRYB2|nr:hypothetical protein, conserved [Trypanosoma brucei brucei TREU927]AAX69253.1 hypothetical protein, conserved [Trypanosoma brucei]AAZ13472.1 hypothetical protein, conserved [Trypanosoma brucei brucei TREU927]